MLGKCFSVLCLLSFIFAIACGNMDALGKSVLEGCEKSVQLCFSLVGIMAFWNGIMELFKVSGATKFLSRLLKPILKRIFPNAFKDNTAAEEITACISANLIGLANATTPLAISAIGKMKRGVRANYATNEMLLLCMLGCASFNLIPTTILAIRQGAGAKITYEILIPVWICSFACMVLGIILCKLLGKIYGDS